MSKISKPSVNLDAVSRLHDSTTMFHGFIYFAREAADAYRDLGVRGPSGYFSSRAAALGEVPAEVVVATFYNFSPDLVHRAMDGVWDRTSAVNLELARWRAVAEVFDSTVREKITSQQIEEAIEILKPTIDGLVWPGRPLAAANAASLEHLAKSRFSSDRLLRLWQLVTILREWRGDAHIALLVSEPLDGVECTVVSEAVAGLAPGVFQTTRGWSDSRWTSAVGRLSDRGWTNADATITTMGRRRREEIEVRTNELASMIWNDESCIDRLCELLAPANKALLAANYFAAIGRPARSDR